jgi:hypothetical protein
MCQKEHMLKHGTAAPLFVSHNLLLALDIWLSFEHFSFELNF